MNELDLEERLVSYEARQAIIAPLLEVKAFLAAQFGCQLSAVKIYGEYLPYEHTDERINYRFRLIRLATAGVSMSFIGDRVGSLAILAACERYAEAAYALDVSVDSDTRALDEAQRCRECLSKAVRLPDAESMLGTLKQIYEIATGHTSYATSLMEALRTTHDGAVVTSVREVIRGYLTYARLLK